MSEVACPKKSRISAFVVNFSTFFQKELRNVKLPLFCCVIKGCVVGVIFYV